MKHDMDALARSMRKGWNFVAPYADEVDPRTAGVVLEWRADQWIAIANDGREYEYIPPQREDR